MTYWLFIDNMRIVTELHFCKWTQSIQRQNTLKNSQQKSPKKLNFKSYISKTRVNSESKLKFSESSFKFLQNSILFCTFYPRGYTTGASAPYSTWCHCQRLVALKELMMSQEKIWICFFCLFLLEMSKNVRKTALFHFSARTMFLLNLFSARILWRNTNKKPKNSTLNGSI